MLDQPRDHGEDHLTELGVVDKVLPEHVNTRVEQFDQKLVCVDNVPLLISDVRARGRRLNCLVQDGTQGDLENLKAIELKGLNGEHQNTDEVQAARIRQLRRTVAHNCANSLQHVQAQHKHVRVEEDKDL